MSRKTDLRKAQREVAARARGAQAKRVGELERTLGCAAMGKAPVPPPTMKPGDGVVVPLRPRCVLEGLA